VAAVSFKCEHCGGPGQKWLCATSRFGPVFLTQRSLSRVVLCLLIRAHPRLRPAAPADGTVMEPVPFGGPPVPLPPLTLTALQAEATAFVQETTNAQGASPTFNAEEKGIILMRWMRKYMEVSRPHGS
jgi:hypothetical protein